MTNHHTTLAYCQLSFCKALFVNFIWNEFFCEYRVWKLKKWKRPKWRVWKKTWTMKKSIPYIYLYYKSLKCVDARKQAHTRTHALTYAKRKKVESELRTDALEAVSQRYNICGSFRNFIVHAIRVKYFWHWKKSGKKEREKKMYKNNGMHHQRQQQ